MTEDPMTELVSHKFTNGLLIQSRGVRSYSWSVPHKLLEEMKARALTLQTQHLERNCGPSSATFN